MRKSESPLLRDSACQCGESGARICCGPGEGTLSENSPYLSQVQYQIGWMPTLPHDSYMRLHHIFIRRAGEYEEVLSDCEVHEAWDQLR